MHEFVYWVYFYCVYIYSVYTLFDTFLIFNIIMF